MSFYPSTTTVYVLSTVLLYVPAWSVRGKCVIHTSPGKLDLIDYMIHTFLIRFLKWNCDLSLLKLNIFCMLRVLVKPNLWEAVERGQQGLVWSIRRLKGTVLWHWLIMASVGAICAIGSDRTPSDRRVHQWTLSPALTLTLAHQLSFLRPVSVGPDPCRLETQEHFRDDLNEATIRHNLAFVKVTECWLAA